MIEALIWAFLAVLLGYGLTRLAYWRGYRDGSKAIADVVRDELANL